VGGAHACSGTAATLKPSPTRTSTIPTVASGAILGFSSAPRAAVNRPKWTVPVAAYSRPAPSSVTAVATTLTTKNVTAASAEATARRRNPTSAYSGSVSVSTATMRLTRSRAAPRTTPPVIEHASRKQYSPGGRVRSTPADSASTPRVSSANSTATTDAVRSPTYEQPTGEQNAPRDCPAAAARNATAAVTAQPSTPATRMGPRRPGTIRSTANTTTAVATAAYAGSSATWSMLIEPPRPGLGRRPRTG